MAGKQRPLAWVETTHRSDDGCTEWRVVVDEVVRQQGELDDDDASGSHAFDAAQDWISRNQLAVAGWRHAIARGLDTSEPGRPRTQSSRSRALLLYGWAKCTVLDGREAVCVAPAEMRALEDGTLPCPVCGEGCGATLEPTGEVKHRALAWNGKRWGPARK